MSFDTAILLALYAIRADGMVQFFTFITQLGSTFVIGSIATAAGLYLLSRKEIASFIGLCVSVIGTIAVVYPLKELVARARPDLVYQAFAEDTFAFPSGHAALSMALYGFLAYLVWKHLPKTAWRYIAVFVAIAFSALIGFSRMYLGLHYVSDVLAGYVIGGVFLALGISVSKRLTRHPIWS
ncbi:phosphatase PAP2 family protein [Candidatus Kaiserbacteria bacterium]|nr:phosphatase PAP2 family protein [Candidatus Kaiserbacteria bacterium]